MKDFDINGLFASSWWYAIELEIHKNHTKEVEAIAPFTSWSRESREIYEINSYHRHQERRDKFMKAFNYLKDVYKDKFPIWQNTHTSGGVHFHLFDFNREWLKGDIIDNLLLNVPLFQKFKDDTFYWRKNSRHEFREDEYIRTDSKSFSICYNRWAIEFRCNNIIDERILGYYQAIVLLWKKQNKDVKKISEELISYSKNWDTERYSCIWDVEVEKLKWYKLNKKEKETLISNVNVLLKTLRDNNLVKSAEALEEYCLEYKILPTKKKENE